MERDARLMRVVYFSRNTIRTSPEAMKWEVDGILEQSQRNNARVGVTGALIFNNGVFGQVLEGPMEAVELTFDRIQADPRHKEVTVLDIKPIAAPSFSGWSMGFVGADEATCEIFKDLAPRADLTEMARRGDAVFDMLRDLALRNELHDRAA